MINPVGSLQLEVPAGVTGDRVLFDQEGCGIGRGVFAPEVIRAVRVPLIEALVADRHVEPVEGKPDRLLWVGDKASFNRHDYEHWLSDVVDDLLLKPGLAAAAIETVWGTPAAIWEGVQLFVAVPGNSPGPHRDATPLASSTESSRSS